MTIRVHFEDGNTVTTGFNGTMAEAEAYYLGKLFNFGDVEGPDRMVRAVRIEVLS